MKRKLKMWSWLCVLLPILPLHAVVEELTQLYPEHASVKAENYLNGLPTAFKRHTGLLPREYCSQYIKIVESREEEQR